MYNTYCKCNGIVLIQYVCTYASYWMMVLPFSCRSSSFNESEQVPGYQDFVTPGTTGSGKLKRKLPVVRKQRLESNDQGMYESPFSRRHTYVLNYLVSRSHQYFDIIWFGWALEVILYHSVNLLKVCPHLMRNGMHWNADWNRIDLVHTSYQTLRACRHRSTITWPVVVQKVLSVHSSLTGARTTRSSRSHETHSKSHSFTSLLYILTFVPITQHWGSTYVSRLVDTYVGGVSVELFVCMYVRTSYFLDACTVRTMNMPWWSAYGGPVVQPGFSPGKKK